MPTLASSPEPSLDVQLEMYHDNFKIKSSD
jgi:hypothetical protein